jgi:hypothetical protein
MSKSTINKTASVIKHANKFFSDSKRTLEKSNRLLDLQFELLPRAYIKPQYHFAALFYPVAHGLHILKGLARLVKGVFLLCSTFFNDSKGDDARATIGMGMLNELEGIFNHLLACFLTIGTFISRTFATIIDLGYGSPACDYDHYNNEFDQNDFVPNFLIDSIKAFGSLVVDVLEGVKEEEIYRKTFSFN